MVTDRDNADKALNKAASYVNYKPRTEKQLRDYLLKSKFEEAIIDSVIKEFKTYKYIDDFNYAIMYFQHCLEKQKGLARIKRELYEKGVDRSTVELAYEELSNIDDVPDEEEMALSVAESMLNDVDIEGLDYNEKNKLKAKIGRRLASRGFSSDVLYKTINKLF